MAVQISYDNELDSPVDPLNVERPDTAFSYAICYAHWWGSSARLKPGRIRTAIGSNRRYKLYPGHVETLRNIVTWARSQGLDMRLTVCTGAHLNGRDYNVYPIYALELQYTENDPSDKTFYGLNHCRFPSSEFILGKLPTHASYRQVLTLALARLPQFLAHLPFTDPYGVFGGYNWNGNKDPAEYPSFGPYMGKGLFAYWTSLVNHIWKGTSSIAKDAPRTCGLKSAEWLTFYKSWYKTDDKDKNY